MKNTETIIFKSLTTRQSPPLLFLLKKFSKPEDFIETKE